MTALHMNRHLAGSLTLALRPLCRKDGTFDLEDTRRHNVIEHDNSFTRHDFYTGDNYTIQPDMLQAMLDDADGGPVTLRSLAKSFIRRDKESKAAGAPKLSLNLWFVRVLNIAGAINTTMMPGGKMTKEVFEALFAEERWSSVVLDNPKPRTLLTLIGNALGMMRYVIFGP